MITAKEANEQSIRMVQGEFTAVMDKVEAEIIAAVSKGKAEVYIHTDGSRRVLLEVCRRLQELDYRTDLIMGPKEGSISIWVSWMGVS